MIKKRSLGRGIGNFLSSEEKIENIINPRESENSGLLEIDINAIKTNSDQPRKIFEKKALEELAESIKNYGVIQPLVVKKEKDNYLVISGERRLRAAKLAGLKKVPAVVKDMKKESLDKISLIENIQREDLNSIEEARAFKYLIEEYNLRQEDLAKEVGKSRQYIGNIMRLLNLDSRVIDMILKGEISSSHGRALLAIKDKDKQYKEALKIVRNSISVASTEKKTSKKTKENLDIFKNDIKDKLTSHLGTKVDFSGRGKHKKLLIEYYSDQDLERICDLILGGKWEMTRFYNMYLVSAFTDKPFKGNSTGVIIDKGDLTEEEKQNIAKDINQSVSVFIKRLDTGEYDTRFYTPSREIKLCGHATMATFYAIAENEYILPIEEGINKIKQFTAAGKVNVELEYQNYKIKNIYMNLKMEKKEKIEQLGRVLEILGLQNKDLGLPYVDCMPEIISTGLCDIIIPVKNEEILKSVDIDFNKAKNLSYELDIISYHVFTTKDGINIHQRTFSPAIGINEETGSGTSTAATMYYLHHNGYSKSDKIYSIQGTYMDRVSRVIAQYNEKDDIVRVGGRAYTFMNGVLTI